MQSCEKTSTVVLRLFGREPTSEDWLCVGRCSYAAAWLAEDRSTARELARAQMVAAAKLATAAAMGAGRGDADRFVLVSALARLSSAFEGGEGILAEAAERALERAAVQLAREGAILRSATTRERAAMAPRFSLEAFQAAILDTGQDRHVLLRETTGSLEEELASVRGPCPALRTLGLFLQATLALGSRDVPPSTKGLTDQDGGPISRLAHWLTADLALTMRRSGAFEAAWSRAAQNSGDALSCALYALTSGAMRSKPVAEALRDDPWALPAALAMTFNGAHAATLLGWGTQAQAAARFKAAQAVEAWRAQGARVEALEQRFGLKVSASAEAREGFRKHESTSGLDLFSAWNLIHLAEECVEGLREATERSVAKEATRRSQLVRRARLAFETEYGRRETAIQAARGKAERVELPPRGPGEAAEGNARKGCLVGLGTGAFVIVTYAVADLTMGTPKLFDRIAPLVVAIASFPVLAGILAYVAVVIKRAALIADGDRRRNRSQKNFYRMRLEAEGAFRDIVDASRRALVAAETSLAEFESGVNDVRAAA